MSKKFTQTIFLEKNVRISYKLLISDSANWQYERSVEDVCNKIA